MRAPSKRCLRGIATSTAAAALVIGMSFTPSASADPEEGAEVTTTQVVPTETQPEVVETQADEPAPQPQATETQPEVVPDTTEEVPPPADTTEVAPPPVTETEVPSVTTEGVPDTTDTPPPDTTVTDDPTTEVPGTPDGYTPPFPAPNLCTGKRADELPEECKTTPPTTTPPTTTPPVTTTTTGTTTGTTDTTTKTVTPPPTTVIIHSTEVRVKVVTKIINKVTFVKTTNNYYYVVHNRVVVGYWQGPQPRNFEEAHRAYVGGQYRKGQPPVGAKTGLDPVIPEVVTGDEFSIAPYAFGAAALFAGVGAAWWLLAGRRRTPSAHSVKCR